MYTLNPKFKGTVYRVANNWFSVITPDPTIPINYAEVGTFYGANVISVAETYAKHPDSKIVAIDPWTDYSDYPEYIGKQESIYDLFMQNLRDCSLNERITVKRGFSNTILPTLEDDSYDIIYIDGNHEPEYVLEDAVLAFRKLKINGFLIFDDYGWGGPDLTKRGIDGFLNGYHKRIKVHGIKASQVFVQKIK
jgi:predicted O-methyltransferase YrrM